MTAPVLIAISINSADDGVRCGECIMLMPNSNCVTCDCDLYELTCTREAWKENMVPRHPNCLQAEARIAAIKREARVEALREVRKMLESHDEDGGAYLVEDMIAKEDGL